jgi:signal transduction histidine kinase/CheY-like chemotaxis protein
LAQIESFKRDTADLALLSESIIAGRLRQVDEVLLVLREALLVNPAGFEQTIKLLRKGPLADETLFVVQANRDGYLSFTDTPNVKPGLYLGDRSYFRYFAEGGKDRLYAAEPSFGRVTRRYTLPLVRPVYDRQGAFAGIVAISINLSSLGNFGARLKLSADTTVSVVNDSGAVVTRSRDLDKVLGQKLPPERMAQLLAADEGVFSGISTFDKDQRVFAYRRVEGQSLIVVAASSLQRVLAQVAQQRRVLMSAGIFASLLILGLLLHYQKRRRVTAQFIAAQQTHLQEVQQRTADLEDALAAAKLADQAKDAFLANVSHELRTPLNAVIGMSSLARRLSHDPVQQAYLDKIGNAGKTLAHLINDLLDLSKIVAGHLEFEKRTFSLRQMLDRSNSVMSYRAVEKGLQLIETVDDAVPDILLGDPLRIEQILLNLLSNAIKFTAAGRVEVRISILSSEAERICLSIEVEDTGPGLQQEQIELLFKPFAQADSSMTRKYGGTGLGLSICKRLSEMMGGGISVSSRPGQGCIFRVTLWLLVGKAEDLPAAGDPAGDSVPAHYVNAHVLVVEDQLLNREIVDALLNLVGIRPRMVCNGQEALDLLADAGPDAFDLVLMDIQMPVLDGLTATRNLRAQPGFERLPIIAMTAHTMAHEREASASAGMNDHIGKPFDNDSFYRCIAKWIPQVKHLTDRSLLDPVEPTRTQGKPSAGGFPVLKGIDTAGGIARLAGNEERYRHWLADFVEEGPATARQIRQTLAAGNNEAARQLAHAFKGRVGMLGMNEVHRVVSELEAALKRGDPVEGWLNKLEQVIEQTRHDIKRTLNLPDYAPPAEVLHEQSPQGPVPEAVAQLVELLEAGDGASAAAIARCLNEYKETDWAPRLQRALSHAQNFDFAAATKALLADGGGWYEV